MRWVHSHLQLQLVSEKKQASSTTQKQHNRPCGCYVVASILFKPPNFELGSLSPPQVVVGNNNKCLQKRPQKKKRKKNMFLFASQAVFLGCANRKARAQHGMNNAEGARWRSHHGLLHGDDLLTVDLPQSPGVAFQSSLQTTSGLREKTEQVDDPQSGARKENNTEALNFLMSFVVIFYSRVQKLFRSLQTEQFCFDSNGQPFFFWSKVVQFDPSLPPHQVSCDS